MISIKIGLGDGMYFVEPLDDITPKESEMLSIFLVNLMAFTVMFAPVSSPEMRREFIDTHNLMRHFRKEVK